MIPDKTVKMISSHNFAHFKIIKQRFQFSYNLIMIQRFRLFFLPLNSQHFKVEIFAVSMI